MFYPRFSATAVERALADTPVVVVDGPRQSGKTTLVRDVIVDHRTFLSLDDDTVLAAARSDPAAFVRDLDRVAIDEIQRAPELLRAIKHSVDRDRRPGRFLLTGSSDLLALPTIADSLAGRMHVVTLLPLARAELLGHRPAFVARLFDANLGAAPVRVEVGDALVGAVLAGGYPEMVARKTPERRRAWARDYVRAIVSRDVRDIASIAHLAELPRLVRALAHHSGQLVNMTELGGQLGLDAKTAARYIGILEQLFLVRRLEPWHSNRLKRLVKTPRLHFLDSGVLAALTGATASALRADRARFGALLETFVFGEVAKQIGWFDAQIAICHYRDKDQHEVDLVLEHEDGSVAGLEVKAAATVTSADFAGLRRLAAARGAKFAAGAVLYDGEIAVPFGPRLYAVPISALW